MSACLDAERDASVREKLQIMKNTNVSWWAVVCYEKSFNPGINSLS